MRVSTMVAQAIDSTLEAKMQKKIEELKAPENIAYKAMTIEAEPIITEAGEEIQKLIDKYTSELVEVAKRYGFSLSTTDEKCSNGKPIPLIAMHINYDGDYRSNYKPQLSVSFADRNFTYDETTKDAVAALREKKQAIKSDLILELELRQKNKDDLYAMLGAVEF